MRSRLVAAGLALLLAGANAAADIIERVLAVVDETPVLLSEALALQGLRRLERQAALQALIDETLMLREASRLKEATVSPDEAERAYESLTAKLEPGATDVDEEALRRIARRQTAILKYVETRFRPQLRVEDAELMAAYQEQYGGRADAPALEAVLPELSARLTSRALDSRIEAWVAELRLQARIRYTAAEPQS
jgi:hypothetical protein